jgi:hypothetical protein
MEWTSFICGDSLIPQEGENNLRIRGTDSFNNSATSSRIHFTYDTQIPNMSVVTPTNHSSFGPMEENITYIYDDAIACRYSLNDGVSWTNITCGQIPIPLEGNNSLRIQGSDSAGNTGTTALLDFTYDATPPQLTLISPLNTTYNTSSILLSISHDAINISVTIDSIAYDYNESAMLTLADGRHTITVLARDEHGNLNQTTRSFLVDTTAPALPSITNYTYIAADGFSIAYLVEDETSNVLVASNDSRVFYNGSAQTIQANATTALTLTVLITATDDAQHTTSQEIILTALGPGEQHANQSNITLENSTYEIIVNQASPNSVYILIPEERNETNITLNLSTYGQGGEINLASNITLEREGVGVVILHSGVYHSLATWNSTIQVPTEVYPSELTLSSATISFALHVGADQELLSEHPIKIVLSDWGTRAGAWTNTTTLIPISLSCDEELTVISPTTNRECFTVEASDLVIWTYHLSTFAAYLAITEDATPATPSRSGGGGGGGIVCTAKWSCSEWSSCSGGMQERICTSDGSCTPVSKMPDEEKKCTGNPELNSQKEQTNPPLYETPALPKKKVLFDINALMTKKVYALGEEPAYSLTLINVGDPGKVIARVKIIIKDIKGHILMEETKEHSVETQKEELIKLNSLPEGDYVLTAQLTYEGQAEPAASEDYFSISGTKQSNNLIFMILGGTTITILSGFIVHKVILKKRMSTNTNQKTTTLEVKPATFFESNNVSADIIPETPDPTFFEKDAHEEEKKTELPSSLTRDDSQSQTDVPRP